ncbi:iripin-2-like [Periplaneta americana]|uniref:iripin-2-like n=1 Tax=Periplaneta americana TaxID=6978 RepID=UPI0037E73372
MCAVKNLFALVLSSLLFSPIFGQVISENVIASTNQFSLQILKTLFTEGKGANLLISPVNLYNALVIIQQGSRGNTQAEIDKVLNSDPDGAKEGYANLTAVLKGEHLNAVVEWGNCVFLKEGITVNNNFSYTVLYNLSGDVEHVNFEQTQAAVDFINGWVTWLDHNTNRTLVNAGDIPVDTLLLSGNGLFFSSPWQNGFNSEETTPDGSFDTLDGTTIQRPIMRLEADLIAGEDIDIAAKFVLLPFLSEEFSLLVVVPDEKDGLSAVLDSLQADQLLAMIRGTEYRHVSLSLPRVNLLNTLSFKSELQELGVNEVFNSAGDLTGVASIPVVLQDIRQAVALELNENGAVFSNNNSKQETKKNSGSGAKYKDLEVNAGKQETKKNGGSGAKYEDLEVNADHPYLLFVVNKDNAVPIFSAWDGGVVSSKA